MCICINLVSVCGIELSPDESDRHHGHYTHDCGEEDDQPHNLLIQRVTCGTYNQTKKYLTSVIFEKAVLLYTGWSPSCWDYIISWRLLANIWPFWLQNDAIIDSKMLWIWFSQWNLQQKYDATSTPVDVSMKSKTNCLGCLGIQIQIYMTKQ